MHFFVNAQSREPAISRVLPSLVTYRLGIGVWRRQPIVFTCADCRDRRSDHVKTGYLLDAFNPVIIETISFWSVSFV
jgi:hypothetical protein